MKYDFDTVVNRRGTDSLKWDVKDTELPMWVADMDFQAAPEIREALSERVSHGIFGYTDVTDEWYQSYISWWDRRHHFTMQKDWLVFCTGVIPAISSAVRKLATPNENVVIQTPVYNIFFNSIVNNGCRVLESPLRYENGVYKMDFADLERKLSDPQTSLMILCNPHNPVGRIWNRDELEKVGELCKKHGVTVISDEIHCDITRPGTEYIPFASVSENCKEISITCMAPTKAFNLAGLHSAAVCVPNQFLRHKVWRALNTDEVGEPNSFASLAAITAFTKGEEWINQLNAYVFSNRDYLEEFVKKNLPWVHVVHGNATYLVWLDISYIHKDSQQVAARLRETTGLFVNAGNAYGTTGSGFLRINVACPRKTLLDGLERLKTGLQMMIDERK